MAERSRIRSSQPVLIFDLEMLRAMADETRARIMRLLCTPELGRMVPYTVNEIAEHFDLTASTVSHHLQLLKRASLVRMERRGKERCYSLDFGGLHRRVGQFYDLLDSIRQATEQAKRDSEP